ncbi:hypothetical protein GOC16_33705, partial [Sinorhizobium meliloti]|nr:hypothetical protein [Sinorhizobium meliloti]
ELKAGDIVILDNLGSHKGQEIRAAIPLRSSSENDPHFRSSDCTGEGYFEAFNQAMLRPS